MDPLVSPHSTKQLSAVLKRAGLRPQTTQRLLAEGVDLAALPALTGSDLARLELDAAEHATLKALVADELYEAGDRAFAEKRYELAVEQYLSALRAGYKQPGIVHNDLGACYSRLQRHGDALREFGLAVDAKPDDPMRLANRATSYEKLGQHEEAAADLRKALAHADGGSRAGVEAKLQRNLKKLAASGGGAAGGSEAARGASAAGASGPASGSLKKVGGVSDSANAALRQTPSMALSSARSEAYGASMVPAQATIAEPAAAPAVAAGGAVPQPMTSPGPAPPNGVDTTRSRALLNTVKRMGGMEGWAIEPVAAAAPSAASVAASRSPPRARPSPQRSDAAVEYKAMTQARLAREAGEATAGEPHNAEWGANELQDHEERLRQADEQIAQLARDVGLPRGPAGVPDGSYQRSGHDHLCDKPACEYEREQRQLLKEKLAAVEQFSGDGAVLELIHLRTKVASLMNGSEGGKLHGKVHHLQQLVTELSKQYDAKEAELQALKGGGSSIVSAVFTNSGAIGIQYGDQDGRAVIARLDEGTPAASIRLGLEQGMVLALVQGVSTEQMPFMAVMNALRDARRPLTLEFAGEGPPGDAVAQSLHRDLQAAQAEICELRDAASAMPFEGDAAVAARQELEHTHQQLEVALTTQAQARQEQAALHSRIQAAEAQAESFRLQLAHLAPPGSQNAERLRDGGIAQLAQSQSQIAGLLQDRAATAAQMSALNEELAQWRNGYGAGGDASFGAGDAETQQMRLREQDMRLQMQQQEQVLQQRLQQVEGGMQETMRLQAQAHEQKLAEVQQQQQLDSGSATRHKEELRSLEKTLKEAVDVTQSDLTAQQSEINELHERLALQQAEWQEKLDRETEDVRGEVEREHEIATEQIIAALTDAEGRNRTLEQQIAEVQRGARDGSQKASQDVVDARRQLREAHFDSAQIKANQDMELDMLKVELETTRADLDNARLGNCDGDKDTLELLSKLRRDLADERQSSQRSRFDAQETIANVLREKNALEHELKDSQETARQEIERVEEESQALRSRALQAPPPVKPAEGLAELREVKSELRREKSKSVTQLKRLQSDSVGQKRKLDVLELQKQGWEQEQARQAEDARDQLAAERNHAGVRLAARQSQLEQAHGAAQDALRQDLQHSQQTISALQDQIDHMQIGMLPPVAGANAQQVLAENSMRQQSELQHMAAVHQQQLAQTNQQLAEVSAQLQEQAAGEGSEAMSRSNGVLKMNAQQQLKESETQRDALAAHVAELEQEVAALRSENEEINSALHELVETAEAGGGDGASAAELKELQDKVSDSENMVKELQLMLEKVTADLARKGEQLKQRGPAAASAVAAGAASPMVGTLSQSPQPHGQRLAWRDSTVGRTQERFGAGVRKAQVTAAFSSASDSYSIKQVPVAAAVSVEEDETVSLGEYELQLRDWVKQRISRFDTDAAFATKRKAEHSNRENYIKFLNNKAEQTLAAECKSDARASAAVTPQIFNGRN